jgi:hypothetical protein
LSRRAHYTEISMMQDQNGFSMRLMRSQSQYDLPTAVTFLMAGLGIGSLLAILFVPSSARPALVPQASSQRAR